MPPALAAGGMGPPSGKVPTSVAAVSGDAAGAAVSDGDPARGSSAPPPHASAAASRPMAIGREAVNGRAERIDEREGSEVLDREGDPLVDGFVLERHELAVREAHFPALQLADL